MTLQGWRITTLVTCLIAVGLVINFGLAGWNAPAITHAIDATGRSSLILFAIAFTASSVESLWPSSLSRWSLRNRRWIGLSFASSLCWKSLDLDALLAHLCETCEARPPLVLSPLLGVHLGVDSNSICETHTSKSSHRSIDVSGSQPAF